MIIARGMILLPIVIEHSALNRKGVKNRMIMGERCQVARDDCAIFPTKNEERFGTLSNLQNHGT